MIPTRTGSQSQKESESSAMRRHRTRLRIMSNGRVQSTDLPIGYVSKGQPGTRGILATECLGSHARRAAAMAPDQRLRWGLENTSKVFPEMTTEFERGRTISWDDEAWSLG